MVKTSGSPQLAFVVYMSLWEKGVNPNRINVTIYRHHSTENDFVSNFETKNTHSVSAQAARSAAKLLEAIPTI